MGCLFPEQEHQHCYQLVVIVQHQGLIHGNWLLDLEMIRLLMLVHGLSLLRRKRGLWILILICLYPFSLLFIIGRHNVLNHRSSYILMRCCVDETDLKKLILVEDVSQPSALVVDIFAACLTHVLLAVNTISKCVFIFTFWAQQSSEVLGRLII